MEPWIRDGFWNFFRSCLQGFREGRIVPVQFNSMGDPENGGRFTVQKYHSNKTVSKDASQHARIALRPLNRGWMDQGAMAGSVNLWEQSHGAVHATRSGRGRGGGGIGNGSKAGSRPAPSGVCRVARIR